MKMTSFLCKIVIYADVVRLDGIVTSPYSDPVQQLPSFTQVDNGDTDRTIKQTAPQGGWWCNFRNPNRVDEVNI